MDDAMKDDAKHDDAKRDEQQREAIARYLAAYKAFDIEAMLAELDEGIVFENYAGGQLTSESSGIAAFRALAEQAKALFSEREQRVTGMARRGDALVAEIAWRGRLAAEIPGWPAPGTLIEMTGEAEFGFAGARIARIVDRS